MDNRQPRQSQTSGNDGDTILPRTTARGGRSPTAETVVLLCGFFLIQYPLSAIGLVGLFALSPIVIIEPWTLITSTYAHGSVGHLISNLIGLILLGAFVERTTTRLRFHTFFILTGALAGVAEITLGSLLAFSPRAVLGASGAVFALLGYLITSNAIADTLISTVDQLTDASWVVTAALIVLAAVMAILLSGPGTALVGHAAGLAIGLLAGRMRLLKINNSSSTRAQREI
ncbi:rhomboid family intramembrane serine protease [Haloquadratum walsbyi]|jgi:Uncharacterized membrane protein (homolog of Drosophila rhomboid)|uniref:Rhomboid family protein n=1 Tax=Haloquadratum walsbyi J07HQW2 TaxID=1238425 RepID=U1PQ90_9EURY|nr:rhomboid family intramembrane serine protease [Haloquadratum walsbyi]ERG94486.1 MAG: rhomboid family protein [Haloquadratum walsbyi J07HQW2]